MSEKQIELENLSADLASLCSVAEVLNDEIIRMNVPDESENQWAKITGLSSALTELINIRKSRIDEAI